jgi:hypothetical protein
MNEAPSIMTDHPQSNPNHLKLIITLPFHPKSLLITSLTSDHRKERFNQIPTKAAIKSVQQHENIIGRLLIARPVKKTELLI